MDTQIKRTTSYPTSGTGRLGKEIRITPKAHINIMAPGYKTEFFTETVELCIGIGKDHVASLVMDIEAWNALKAGEPVNITTTEEYKKKYIYKIRKK